MVSTHLSTWNFNLLSLKGRKWNCSAAHHPWCMHELQNIIWADDFKMVPASEEVRPFLHFISIQLIRRRTWAYNRSSYYIGLTSLLDGGTWRQKHFKHFFICFLFDLAYLVSPWSWHLHLSFSSLVRHVSYDLLFVFSACRCILHVLLLSKLTLTTVQNFDFHKN